VRGITAGAVVVAGCGRVGGTADDVPCGDISTGAPVNASPRPMRYVLAGGLVAARRRPLLRDRPVACGAAYGLLLYAIMNYVVVPLSAAAHGGAKDPLWVALSIVVHAVLIGIPIALLTRRGLLAPA